MKWMKLLQFKLINLNTRVQREIKGVTFQLFNLIWTAETVKLG